MFEIALLFLLLIAAWYILPSFFKSPVSEQSIYLEQIKIPEDSVLRRHFIAHLRSEIEANLHPCPTDPALRPYHEALVEDALKHRLARAR